MDKKDSQIIITHDKENGVYVAHPVGVSGIVIQTEKFEDIPKELARSFQVLMDYSIYTKNYILK